jgi:hypothetical protein
MNSHWKTFLDNIKRVYHIIFNKRNIEEIRKDYFEERWISKEELVRLLEHEENQFIENYTTLQKDYNDMLKYFNMNALSNYSLLERKYQGTLKK